MLQIPPLSTYLLNVIEDWQILISVNHVINVYQTNLQIISVILIIFKNSGRYNTEYGSPVHVPIRLNNPVKEQFNFHEFPRLLKYTKNCCVRLSEITKHIFLPDTVGFLNLCNRTYVRSKDLTFTADNSTSTLLVIYGTDQNQSKNK